MGTMTSVSLAPSNSAKGIRSSKGTGSNMSPVKANAEALKVENEKADAINKSRTGVGLRVMVGQTRGKNPSVVTWEAFDDDTKTRPSTIAQFMEVTSTKDEPDMVAYLIDGYNKSAYSQASDEIGEFINDAWDKETQSQFRLIVRNYVRALAGTKTLEEVVNLVKPAIDMAFAAKQTPPAAPATA